MKKICAVTGNRAEYGLMKHILKRVQNSVFLELQLVVTGAHLVPEYGFTYQEIEDDGFSISRKVEMLLSSDSPVGLTKSLGVAMMAFADVFAELKPDIVFLVGDRSEILAVAVAALLAQIPIAHHSGGEITEGAIDDMIRHSITKMSHLHFVANEVYRQRVIQLGESPDRVFCVGGLGIDCIQNVQILSREELEKSLDFKFAKLNFLVTFHPVTMEYGNAIQQMQELLEALKMFDDAHIVFTMPNSDLEGRAIAGLVNEYVSIHSNTSKAYVSLGQQRYFSCLSLVDVVIGNSSSGLTEAPYFGKPTVNIGSRQEGRLKAASVIDAKPISEDIVHAIRKAISEEFQKSIQQVSGTYGASGCSEKLVEILEQQNINGLFSKKFHDCALQDG